MSEPSSAAVSIRTARPADADAMAEVHARSWRATYGNLVPEALIDDVAASRPARVDRWRTWLADPERVGDAFVAELDARLVGFVFWGPSGEPDSGPEVAEVRAIYLDPAVIGSGIGRALFEAAIDDIVGHGFMSAILWVLDTNDRAQRFYEAAGWRPDGRTKTDERPGGSLHEIRYARTLTGDSASP